METPICDFVKKYADENTVRLHMPGHKGDGVLGIEKFDITEIDGADVLYSSEGIIRKSEQNAAQLFGAVRTLYSAEGSSLCIRAMIYLAVMYAKHLGKQAHILAARNAHKTFLSAVSLLDVAVSWIYPQKNEGLVSCKITADMLEEHIGGMSQKPTAVFITSPDYLGNIADIAGISAVCRKYDILLIVDNAHGAYLNFLPVSRHPMSLGADICCDSAHKTLPCITGGAYLHISEGAPKIFADICENAMSLFASTSPSYLILQSLDALNAYLSGGYKQRLNVFCQSVKTLKNEIQSIGFTLLGDEPLKITVFTKLYGYTGGDFAEILKQNGIVCEFYDRDYIVLMLTPGNTEEELEKIKNTFLQIPKRAALSHKFVQIAKPEVRMSPREAMLSASEELNINDCLGRVLATASVSCPPAIPIVVCGEVIDRAAIEMFDYYGIKKCRVVSEK